MSESSAKLDSNPPKVEVTASNTSVLCSSDGEPTISKPMPLWRKLAFASGGLPMQMMQNVISFFLPLFLLETVNLIPSFLSVVLLAARISDAVTDPLVGLLVLKTKSRFGQKRPWILFSTPVFVASFFALFYAVHWPAPAKLCFYLVAIVVLQFGLTAFHIPYSSLTMVLTHVPEERDLLTAFRMFSEVLAILFGVAVFGAIIAPYRVVSSCENSLFTNGTTVANFTEVTAISQPFVHPDAKRREAWAYMLAASVTCVICTVASLICFFGTRETGINLADTTADDVGAGDGDGGNATTPVGIFTAVRKVLTYPPYLYLMGAFLFLSLGIQFLQGNIALFITHSLHMSNYLIPGILCLLGFTILLVPLAQVLLRRLGKKTTMALGIVNVIPLLVLLNFISERPSLWIFFGMMIWASVTIAVAMLLPWSMLPDVIDAFQLQYSMRLESVFYSLIVFFNKFAVGISLAMSAGILELVGYDSSSNACHQPPEVGKTLRLLSSVAPIGFLIPALVFLYYYPLGNRELEEMRSKLLLRSNASTLDIVRSDVTINSAPSTQQP
uniref:Major facilitator superfamily domain containing protein n=1 Tax=Echinococcus granulosus TaxID=6210 RepID=A0A068WSK7_ECHGR|nr:major facilitator superfamily domain containing protein [Echinococcus granulosus]